MRRWRIGGLVVGASLFMTTGMTTGMATAQATDEEPMTREQFQESLREQARPAVENPALAEALATGAPAASTTADDVSAAAVTEGLCYSQSYTDPDEADVPRLDATSYEIAYDCASSSFVAALTTTDSWPIDALDSYEIAIDVNDNRADGCFGADYWASIYWEPLRNRVEGGLFRASADGCITPPTRVSDVFYAQPAGNPGNQILFGFPGAPFQSSPLLRWYQIIGEDGPIPVDLLPDGGFDGYPWRGTPGNPCEHRYYLTNGTTGGAADVLFCDNEAASEFLVGDWDGDGVDSFGFRIASSYRFKNSHSATPPDLSIGYGRPGDAVLVGDWDGNGTDTLAVRRGNTYYIRNSLSEGPADITVTYGRPEDVVLVGDWNGDGTDTLAVRRGSTYYIRNSLSDGPAEITVAYGRSTDVVLVGDWDGNGTDTLAVRRGNTYYLKNSFSGGPADITFAYGTASDATFVGDWNGDGRDTLGIRR